MFLFISSFLMLAPLKCCYFKGGCRWSSILKTKRTNIFSCIGNLFFLIHKQDFFRLYIRKHNT
ncbi:hypothetical protein Hanom_Chr07g00662261 [Helianthus anomalus]